MYSQRRNVYKNSAQLRLRIIAQYLASGLLASLEQRGEVTLGRPCLNLTKYMFGYNSYKMDYPQSNPHGSEITEDSQLDSRMGGTHQGCG